MAKFPKPPAELVALVDPRLEGAACAGMAPLFDERGENETAAHAEARHHQARTICSRCPVLLNCHAAATDLPKGQRSGIWAGRTITPKEKRTAA